MLIVAIETDSTVLEMLAMLVDLGDRAFFCTSSADCRGQSFPQETRNFLLAARVLLLIRTTYFIALW